VDRRNFVKASCATLLGGNLFRPRSGLSATAPVKHRLTASEGSFKFDPKQSAPAQVMYYNQSIPGPTLKIPRGRESIIRFHNALKEPSTTHWHGLRIDNAMDGVPGMTQALVQPGEDFEYRITPPDAGTYWYHTHQRAWSQLAFGLAGVLIVEEAQPPLVDQDLVFAIDDWRVDQEYQIDRESLGSLHDWSHGGRLGNLITVNGEPVKNFPVATGERIRLRLLNIANSRIMTLLFNQPDISVIAVDGQPVKPYPLNSNVITLAPGQRADLMIDISAESGSSSPIELLVRDNAYEVATFEIAGTAKRQSPLETPIALPDNPLNRLALPNDFVHIPLHLGGGAMGRMEKATYQGKEMGIRELIEHKKVWAMNGIVGLPEAPLFSVKRGTAISLDIENDNAWPHAMHVHGHHFIDVKNTGEWRDTALYDRGDKRSLKLIADNPGKWLIHCHMIEHQASGMVTWFEVV
jgi:FtsP/CotA-like multicopper oxidase with cupredoxin domain